MTEAVPASQKNFAHCEANSNGADECFTWVSYTVVLKWTHVGYNAECRVWKLLVLFLAPTSLSSGGSRPFSHASADCRKRLITSGAIIIPEPPVLNSCCWAFNSNQHSRARRQISLIGMLTMTSLEYKALLFKIQTNIHVDVITKEQYKLCEKEFCLLFRILFIRYSNVK
jgi:hypothetical protein